MGQDDDPVIRVRGRHVASPFQHFIPGMKLKGKDEEAIRHFFDASLIKMFSERQGITINSGPGVFIYLRGGRAGVTAIRNLGRTIDNSSQECRLHWCFNRRSCS